MSTETAPQYKTQRRLSESEKRSIVGLVSSGMLQKDVAQQFGIHVNTVSAIWASVAKVPQGPASQAWREKLQSSLPQKSVAAIERSVDDIEDVHKAAATGLAVLKGLGHLQGDGMNVTFQQLIQGMPSDLQERYIQTPPQDVVSESESVEQNGVISTK